MLLRAPLAIYSCMILAIGRPRLLLIVPLSFICLTILVAIPLAASRGKLHMAGYIGLALTAFVAAMIFGKLSGVHQITGTIFGVLLSILFFSAVAACLGSLAALALYKAPKDPGD